MNNLTGLMLNNLNKYMKLINEISKRLRLNNKISNNQLFEECYVNND